MIPLLALLAAVAAAPVPAQGCAAETDPGGTITAGEARHAAGSETLSERECLGLAYVNAERFMPAAVAFEGAAREAEIEHSADGANLWLQAGNAALAGGDAGRARTDITRALSFTALQGQMQGEAHLDLARAEVQAGDPAAARRDLDLALKLVPSDPMAWLLSATLARRENDAARAQADIGQAVALAGDDPAVAYEAGNVAAASGAPDAARVAWAQAAKVDPDGPAGQAAATALAQHAELQQTAKTPAKATTTHR